MGAFRRLAACSPDDRRVLLRALVTLTAVRLGLGTLRFARLEAVLRRVGRASRPVAPWPIERICWAVSAAARHSPGTATCLAQALTVRLLLARQGCSADLCFGVAREGSSVRAHAWLARDGEVIFGEPEPDRYILLTPARGHG
jgi:hypothetical protein